MFSRVAGLCLALVLLPLGSVHGQVTEPEMVESVLAEGYAGVYPDILRGRVTTSGAVYDPDRLIASHRYLPLGSLVRVIREDTGESVSVRILDRGPYTGERIMDLSEAGARAIGLRRGDETLIRIVRAADNGVADTGADVTGTRGERERGFTIQLGSYSNEAAAWNARGRADGAWVQRVEVDGQIFYRLNFGRYGSRDDAAEDLDKLEALGFFGFVKSLAEGA
ncbi:MAG: SPOR domain-containing protein [Gemmatimonadota bacterium]|nr:SPOR domain-containing protein [Gemmatimonadota bacterium]